jgi:predicted ATP-dependent Lon-type protease
MLFLLVNFLYSDAVPVPLQVRAIILGSIMLKFLIDSVVARAGTMQVALEAVLAPTAVDTTQGLPQIVILLAGLLRDAAKPAPVIS